MKKEYVDFFSALLTPLIAVVMTYIALQQYRANRLKLRQNLYDRRFALYNATAEFLAYIFSHGAVDNQQLFPFLQRTRESYFLFGPDVADYVTTLHKKAVHLDSLNQQLQSIPIGEERTRLAHERGELVNWFGDQCDVARRKFAKKLALRRV